VLGIDEVHRGAGGDVVEVDVGRVLAEASHDDVGWPATDELTCPARPHGVKVQVRSGAAPDTNL
jgi:hypothetical protein